MAKRKTHKRRNPVWVGLGTLILIGLIGWIGYSLFQTYSRRYAIEQQKQEFKETISRLEHKNEHLEKLKGYLNTETYKQRQARKKLNVQKKDEQAVAVSQKTSKPNNSSKRSEEELVRILRKEEAFQLVRPSSNAEKWWAFFFDKQRFPAKS